MPTPIVTIIIPTYQAERTLQAALDSVTSQSFADWEILVMDGGSKDATLALVQKAAAADSRIRFISQKDNGVYDAMNKSIAEARGTWVYFLGSDDLLNDEQVLTTASPALLTDHVSAMLYGNVTSPSYKGVYDGEFDYPKLLRRNISHQAIFYRRTIFDKVPAYNLNYKGYADWDLNIRIFEDNGLPVRYIGGVIARFGPDGISSRHDEPFLREVLFPAWMRLVRQEGMRILRPLQDYDEVWRLLRNARFSSLPAGMPVPVAQMAAWQQRISYRMLKIGALSKGAMFISYCRHLITGAFK